MKQNKAICDLHDYDSPIRRADGAVPYNSHLSFTDFWFPGHTPEFRNTVSGRWHFGVVALMDARFSVTGCIFEIQANSDNPCRVKSERPGRPVVFSTRTEAVRTAAARLIRSIRASRYWKCQKYGIFFDQMDRPLMNRVIYWIRSIAAKECQKPEPRPITMPPEPPQPPASTGLDLLDYINTMDYLEKTRKIKAPR